MNSEKYEIKERALDGPMLPLIQRINMIRKDNAALQELTNITFLDTANDALVAPENSSIIAKRIKGANLAILEPAGHCFWLEQPEQSAVEIAKFLASVT